MHKSTPHFLLCTETLGRAGLRAGTAGTGGGKPAPFAGAPLAQLSRPATELARLLACLDDGAGLALLTALASKPDSVDKALDEALAAGLLRRQHDHFRYAQAALAQAVYQAIPAGQRAGLHLRIGRRMLASAADATLPAALPAILAQLNRGAAGMPMRAERERCAGLNLRASRIARQQRSLTTALAYAASGLGLLDEAPGRQHDLRFALARQHAECLMLLGRYAEAGPGLNDLAERAVAPAERAVAARLQIGYQAALDRPDRALAIAATELARGGLHRSLPANDASVTAAIAALWSELARGGHAVFTGAVAGRAAGTAPGADQDRQARLDAMAGVLALSLRVDQALCLQMVARSMHAGRQPGADGGAAMALAYVAFGIGAGQRDDGARHAWALGCHGLALAKRAPGCAAGAASELFFAQLLMPWHAPLAAARQALHAALERALADCEPLVAVQARLALIDLAIVRGEPLTLVQKQLETALQQLRGGFAMAAQLLRSRLALIAGLRGETGAGADAAPAAPPQALAARSQAIQRLKLLYHRGDHAGALRAAHAAQALLDRSPPDVEYAECAFYSALNHAALHRHAAPAQQPAHRRAFAGHRAELARLVRHQPGNFAPLTALLAAEAARLDAGDDDNGAAYDLAIAAAVEHEMVHVEALAHELAARRCTAAGAADAAHGHLRQACRAYLRWGAPGKAARLERQEHR